ncbi:N protein [NL63-related bat coronavirus]|uniref:Nucleoprotein n=1 Tax=NL63-related bat coronavirus TaxID=1920748 RepID=A0A1L2KGB9_9ALPC|nr:N protein [NL63-related bat coronavirus]APD51479.1 N protein [NL63-related bat coronavirus]
MATVNWADDKRGKRKYPPPSFYLPLVVKSDKQPYKVIPRNLVPKGKGNKDQQIGYWNVQRRWRMRKGQRVDIDPKVHFYYLGTGPRADLKFRERAEDVVWVAMQGSKTEPTNLGNRKRNQKPIQPEFDIQLPNELEVVEFEDRSNSSSRASSRASSRGNSRETSRSNSRQQSRDNSRSPSRSRSNSTSESSQNSAQDLVAAVTAALKNLGFEPPKSDKSGNASGTSTPKGKKKPKQAKSNEQGSPNNVPSDKSQMNKPKWKRVPNASENVIKCFGPRDFDHNMGDADLVQNGVEAKNFPQIAELIPTQAAMFFDSEVSTKEMGNKVQIIYTYKMLVDKDNKHLPKFLEQVSAFTKPSVVKETQSHPLQNTMPEPAQLNVAAAEFKPPVTTASDGSNAEIEIVDEVLH